VVHRVNNINLFRIIGILFIAETSPRENDPNPSLIIVEFVIKMVFLLFFEGGSSSILEVFI
jgi:hypothetical protein